MTHIHTYSIRSIDIYSVASLAVTYQSCIAAVGTVHHFEGLNRPVRWPGVCA